MAARLLFGRELDYRWVMVGLLAPDLIDKPIGRILLRRRFQSGRLLGHSLLFASLIVWLALGAAQRNPDSCFRSKTLEAGVGVLVHLGMDWIWTEPCIALWPALGRFPAKPMGGRWWKAFLPGFRGGKAAEEVLGLVALGWLYRNSTLKRNSGEFAERGRLFD